MRTTIYKIQPGKVEKLREWGREIMKNRRNEAEQSLKNENLREEVLNIFKINNEYYAVFGISEMPGGEEKGRKLMEIDKKHRAIMRDVMGHKVDMEGIYNLRNSVL